MLDIWWGLRLAEQARVTWTIGLFLPLLVGLLGFFLLAAAALPDEVPSEGLCDLKDYYSANRGYFWGLFAGVVLLFTAHTITVSWLALGGADPARLILRYVPTLGLAVLAASLAVVRRGWWHSTVILFLLVGMLASYLSRPLA